MKQFIFIALMSIANLVSGQSIKYLSIDDQQTLLDEACSSKKNVIVQFNKGEINAYDFSKDEVTFVNRFYRVNAVPLNGNLAKEYQEYTKGGECFVIINAKGEVLADGKNNARRVFRQAKQNTILAKCKVTPKVEEQPIDTFKRVVVVPPAAPPKQKPTVSDTTVIRKRQEIVVPVQTDVLMWTVQIDAFQNRDFAEKRAQVVRGISEVTDAVYVQEVYSQSLNMPLYHVVTGQFDDRPSAYEYSQRLYRKMKPDAKEGTADYKDVCLKQMVFTRPQNKFSAQ